MEPNLREMIRVKEYEYIIYIHDGLIGLVLEVRIPEGIELGPHLFQLVLGRANLREIAQPISSQILYPVP